MRRRFVFLMAVSVCLAVAFTPLMADRAERSADRTKGAPTGVSQDDRTSVHPVVRQMPLQHRVGGDLAATNRAASLVRQAGMVENNDEAIAALFQAISLDPENEKMLAEAYSALGNLYEGAATKQVQFYGLAMQNTSDPAARAALQNRINDLGGDVFAVNALPAGNASSTRDLGPDDTCDGGTVVTLPWSEVMSVTPAGDHNFRTIDVPGPNGWALRIETISENPPFFDDTTLALWATCTDGVAEGQLYLNDDGGEGFMSLIQTECLAPGSYYLDVYGFFDITEVLDFTLDIQLTDVCILPDPDAFEPDDTKDTASGIGLPSSLPTHANGWGRAKSEIQEHTIFPPFDMDNVEFAVSPGAEFVRMGTAITFPTFFNGFTNVPAGTDIDSYIELYYGVEPDYGGLCNDPANGFNPYCRSDEDCPPPVGDPIPGLPTCMPLYLFVFNGVPVFFPETPLAYNEDKGFGDWGSELVVCLPRSDNNTPSLTADGDWVLRVMSSPLYDPAGTFFYQVQVKNEVQCRFEVEPNNGPFGANPLVLGETVNGFQEYSEFFGDYDAGNVPPGYYAFFVGDPDWWAFDTTPGELTLAGFATDGFDIYTCDTTLLLYVGPDDDGFFYDTGVFEDDSGPGYLSELFVVVPSADELLGNQVADANYFIDVTSWWLNPNFPWTMYTMGQIFVEPDVEVEPNDTCETANAVEDGSVLLGNVTATCDYDSFSFSLAEDRYVSFETDGASGDTTMALWADGVYSACDDDGGNVLFSKIEGCLPAGNYCAQVRAYTGTSTISDYEFSFNDLGPCVATDPPTIEADGLYRCDGSGYASSEDEFTTCPN